MIMFHIRSKAIKQASLYTDGGKIKYTASLKKKFGNDYLPKNSEQNLYANIFIFSRYFTTVTFDTF